MVFLAVKDSGSDINKGFLWQETEGNLFALPNSRHVREIY